MPALSSKRKKSRRGGLSKKDKLISKANLTHWDHIPRKQFILIHRAVRQQNFKKLISLCRFSKDPILRQTKVVALIQQEKYEPALRLLQSYDKNLSHNSISLFQKAYCEYRLQRYKKAFATLKILKSEKNLSEQQQQAILCLKAQIYGRLHKFDKSLKLLQKIKPGGKLTREDIQTNILAFQASKSLFSPCSNSNSMLVDIEAPTTLEQMFNLGSLYLGQGQIDQSIHWLTQAKKAALDSNSTKQMCSAIELQLGYAHQMLGDASAAKRHYRNLRNFRGIEKTLAINNLVSLHPPIFRKNKKDKKDRLEILRKKLIKLCEKPTVPIWQRKLIYLSAFLSVLKNKKKNHLCQDLINNYPFRKLAPNFKAFLSKISAFSKFPSVSRKPPVKGPMLQLRYSMYLQSLYTHRKFSVLRKQLLSPPSFISQLPSFIISRARYLKSHPTSPEDRDYAIQSLLATKNADATVQSCIWLAESDSEAALKLLSSSDHPKLQALYKNLLTSDEEKHEAPAAPLSSLSTSKTLIKKVMDTPVMPSKKKKRKRKKRLPKPLPNGELPPIDPHRWLSKQAKVKLGLLRSKKEAKKPSTGSSKKTSSGSRSSKKKKKRR